MQLNGIFFRNTTISAILVSTFWIQILVFEREYKVIHFTREGDIAQIFTKRDVLRIS
jgi:hypothetical protein